MMGSVEVVGAEIEWLGQNGFAVVGSAEMVGPKYNGSAKVALP